MINVQPNQLIRRESSHRFSSAKFSQPSTKPILSKKEREVSCPTLFQSKPKFVMRPLSSRPVNDFTCLAQRAELFSCIRPPKPASESSCRTGSIRSVANVDDGNRPTPLRQLQRSLGIAGIPRSVPANVCRRKSKVPGSPEGSFGCRAETR